MLNLLIANCLLTLAVQSYNSAAAAVCHSCEGIRVHKSSLTQTLALSSQPFPPSSAQTMPRPHPWLTCLLTHTHTCLTALFRDYQGSWYQKGKTNLDFTEARDSEWQWHQLGHMQVCTSLQTDNHASTPLLSFYRPNALPAPQPTASKH